TFAGAAYVKQLRHVPVCASGLFTTTFTAPAACAVVVPVIVVGLIVTMVRADPLNETVAPAWKPVPVSVTPVPPVLGPLAGETALTVGGGATYVKQPVHVPLPASSLVTMTSTRPAVCAVVMPVMLVAVTVDTVMADPPKDAVAPAWNPVPLTVVEVPPAIPPLLGVTDVTVGVGRGAYAKHTLPVP